MEINAEVMSALQLYHGLMSELPIPGAGYGYAPAPLGGGPGPNLSLPGGPPAYALTQVGYD